MSSNVSKSQSQIIFKSFAVLCDFGIAFLPLLAGIAFFGLSPLPKFSWIGIWIITAFVLPWLERKFFKLSLGEMIWSASADSLRLAFASFLTFLVYFSLFFLIQREIFHHPLFQRALAIELPAFSPDVSSPSSEWSALPFFFTLGAWPKKFDGQPIFYSVPYEKGPPSQFVGHLAGRWKMPDVLWIAEGPKTPLEIAREDLKTCMLAPALSLNCADVREKMLKRPIQEMGKMNPLAWRLRWFSIKNGGESAAQGFMIEAENTTQMETRYVLVNPKGRHQAFILHSKLDSDGEHARAVLRQAIAGLKSLSELSEAQVFIDRELSDTSVTRESNLDDLAKIQAELVSKISISPASFEAYYHLAGTALLATKKDPALSSLTRPLILNAYQFAKDVAPQDPRLPSLENMTIEAKKF